MSDYALQLSDAEIMRYRMMAQGAALEEREQWTAAGIVAGAHVADIGCGPGAVSAVLAGIVAPDGTVRAVDSDAEALRTAQQLAELAGVANVTFAEGTATESGIAPETVDVVMMRHVLAHNGGQEQPIVDHLTTLVKPGGSVYLVDVDATAMRFHPPDSVGSLPELADAYLEFHARRGNDLSVGLRLGELLVRAGLEDVLHRGQYAILRPPPGMRPPSWAAREAMLADGVIGPDDVERWEADFARLDRGGVDVTMFVPSFSAWGRKPAVPPAHSTLEVGRASAES